VATLQSYCACYAVQRLDGEVTSGQMMGSVMGMMMPEAASSDVKVARSYNRGEMEKNERQPEFKEAQHNGAAP
jgi:hypothetical protein